MLVTVQNVREKKNNLSVIPCFVANSLSSPKTFLCPISHFFKLKNWLGVLKSTLKNK
jgi:hypothetical protein